MFETSVGNIVVLVSQTVSRREIGFAEKNYQELAFPQINLNLQSQAGEAFPDSQTLNLC